MENGPTFCGLFRISELYDIIMIESEIGRTFWFFRAIWNGVNYLFLFIFVYYLVLIDHTVQKLQNLHMYGVIQKKKPIQLKMMHEQKYKACLSQSISATKNKRNGDFIFWNHQIINKNYKPSISTLHLYVRKNKKNMLALLHIK